MALPSSQPADLLTERNETIARRARIGLGAILAGVLVAVIGDHASMATRPLWADAMDGTGIVLVGIGYWLFSRPAIRARPVPLVLAIVALTCGMRALSGIWFGDVHHTAILCIMVVLAAGATLPWGMRAQLAAVAIAATAIVVNERFAPAGVLEPPAHLVAAVVTAMALSVALAFDLQRHRARLFGENMQRLRAEESLAQLNLDLEQRVEERTAELAAAKQRLERQEAALLALVENTTDSIWSVDRDGIVRVMNSVFRERCRQRFGVDYSAEGFRDQVPPPIWDELTALYERAFRGEHVQVETTFPGDLDSQHFLLSVHPIVENGVVTGATVFSKDITARKRVEAQAREHQAELAHVLRLGTMGEMAAGLAHEINQPLGAIANYAQGCALRLRSGSLDAAGLLPIIDQIAGEALRAAEIIRRLRDLIRKETPQQEEVDLNALVTDSTRMIEAQARQHGINVELDLARDLPRVACDGIQIEQVVLNLLLNGVEAVRAATNGERTVAVTTACAGAAGVEVAIRDSGIGVPDPPADVFAPFFSTKPNGLGMGLSISRSIVEAHGGRLSASRNTGRGSTFRFTLPLAAESVEPARASVG